MKYLNRYKLFENLTNSQVEISEFLSKISMPQSKIPQIIDWWNSNRQHIKIHLFSFNTNKPIAGVFLGSDTICINNRTPMPPHIKLFLALHESRHCDQHREEGFMQGYYNTVINNDKQSFLTSYSELEKDANDFAISSMRQCGFNREMDFEESRLRSNERAGEMVFNMMSEDIKRLRPQDFFDLLKKQIL